MSDKQLVVRQASPLMPSREEKHNLMKSYLEAGLVNRSDFSNYADMAAEFLAIVALVHGLNPMLKEVHVWPITRKVQGADKVVGIETSVGVYGYQRQADQRARFVQIEAEGVRKDLRVGKALPPPTGENAG